MAIKRMTQDNDFVRLPGIPREEKVEKDENSPSKQNLKHEPIFCKASDHPRKTMYMSRAEGTRAYDHADVTVEGDASHRPYWA